MQNVNPGLFILTIFIFKFYFLLAPDFLSCRQCIVLDCYDVLQYPTKKTSGAYFVGRRAEYAALAAVRSRIDLNGKKSANFAGHPSDAFLELRLQLMELGVI